MCLAIPGRIEEITDKGEFDRIGRVSFGATDSGAGVIKQVNLAYVPEAKVGDYVIVHVGFAISRLDEEEAGKVFEYLNQLGDLGELK
ncbi:MAG: HypC/HybG/HupF family hydrogenase formation chaperone [Elusimicrobia bacterium]|nr:HypC/HybG/HupF family hydrogenase formation chaperone [Elusimicrobiota bacterium]